MSARAFHQITRVGFVSEFSQTNRHSLALFASTEDSHSTSTESTSSSSSSSDSSTASSKLLSFLLLRWFPAVPWSDRCVVSVVGVLLSNISDCEELSHQFGENSQAVFSVELEIAVIVTLYLTSMAVYSAKSSGVIWENLKTLYLTRYKFNSASVASSGLLCCFFLSSLQNDFHSSTNCGSVQSFISATVGVNRFRISISSSGSFLSESSRERYWIAWSGEDNSKRYQKPRGTCEQNKLAYQHIPT